MCCQLTSFFAGSSCNQQRTSSGRSDLSSRWTFRSAGFAAGGSKRKRLVVSPHDRGFLGPAVTFAVSADPICGPPGSTVTMALTSFGRRSEEHTSELQSPYDLVCRLLLEKKKTSRT